MPYIYKITNDIDSNIYIGKTNHENPQDRFKEHLSDSKRERCKNRQLYKLMNLYGQEHFQFEVIEEVENDEVACQRESYWIEYYDTYKNGLNGTLGGDGKSYLKLNEEEVIKYHCEEAEFVVGRTAKFFDVDRKTIKKILNKNGVKYLTLKEFYSLPSYRKAISESNNPKKRKVKRIDKNGKEEVFESIQDSVKDIDSKGTIKTRVSSVCTSIKTKKPSYGYIWEYID